MKLSERAVATSGQKNHRNDLVKRKNHPKKQSMGTGPVSCPECGCLLDEPQDSSGFDRNLRHHRLFFKEVALIAQNWPKGHAEFDPMGNTEALRGWLLVQAGHCDCLDYRLSAEMAMDAQAMTAFMQAGFTAARKLNRYACIQERAGSLCWLVARSIAWDAVGEQEMRAIHERVKDVYEREGFDIEALLKQALLETRCPHD